MKGNKVKLIVIIALQLLGFPLLTLLVALNLRPIIKSGKSYGIFVYVGLVLTILMAAIYFIVFFKAKVKQKRSPMRQGMKAGALAFCMLFGIFFVVDVIAPAPLLQATQGTIYYEDLTDYKGRSEINKGLTDAFIRKNVENGNLIYAKDFDKKLEAEAPYTYQLEESNSDYMPYCESAEQAPGSTPEEKNANFQKYTAFNKEADTKREEMTEAFIADLQAVGMKDVAIKKLFRYTFNSINDDGYTTYKASWIDMANDGRLTIPVLFHLLFDEREVKGPPFLYITKDGVKTEPVGWCVLDMLGDPMEIDMGEMLPKDGALDNALKALEPIKPALFNNLVPTLLSHPDVLGAPIYLDIGGGKLTLIPSAAYNRGALGYQNMAWLDANGLVYMLCSVFSIRSLFLIFAGIIPILSFATGALIQGKMRIEEFEEDFDAEQEKEEGEADEDIDAESQYDEDDIDQREETLEGESPPGDLGEEILEESPPEEDTTQEEVAEQQDDILEETTMDDVADEKVEE